MSRLLILNALAALLIGLAGCSEAKTQADDDGGTDDPGAVEAMPGTVVNMYPSIHWPNIHRDARNSDVIDVEGSRELQPLFDTDPGTVVAVMTVGPTGNLYATTANATDGSNCRLFAYDTATGDLSWCSDEVGSGAVSSSALSDVDGNIYLADDGNMVSLTADGTLRWKSPIVTAPLSAHFTYDGRLIFITRNGVINVLELEDGAAALEPVELVPGLPPGAATGCLVGGAESGCASANTPAMDPDTGKFFLTLNRPGETVTSLVCMRYVGGEAPRIEPEWESTVLGDGSGASPTLSADASRVYVTDNDNQLLALSAEDGGVIWTYDIGFAPLGSPSVTADGRIIPGPNGAMLAVQDDGDTASLLWERPDAGATGLVAQAGSTGYGVGAGGLFVFDTETGETLQTLAGPRITIGITLDSDGRVFTAAFQGIHGFVPVE